jgi:hypothetical protein
MYLHNTQGRIAFLYVCGLAAAAAAPCFGVLNATFPFEEVCFKLLKGGEGGLQLREYPASASNQGGVTLVAYNASAAITVYQEALEMHTKSLEIRARIYGATATRLWRGSHVNTWNVLQSK